MGILPYIYLPNIKLRLLFQPSRLFCIPTTMEYVWTILKKVLTQGPAVALFFCPTHTACLPAAARDVRNRSVARVANSPRAHHALLLLVRDLTLLITSIPCISGTKVSTSSNWGFDFALD